MSTIFHFDLQHINRASDRSRPWPKRRGIFFLPCHFFLPPVISFHPKYGRSGRNPGPLPYPWPATGKVHVQADNTTIYLGGRMALSISSVCWFFCASTGGSLFVRGGWGTGPAAAVPPVPCCWLTLRDRACKYRRSKISASSAAPYHFLKSFHPFKSITQLIEFLKSRLPRFDYAGTKPYKPHKAFIERHFATMNVEFDGLPAQKPT